MATSIRTLVVDDDPLARRRVRELLAGNPDFVVCGEAADGETALAALRGDPPDLLLLDVQIPGLDGFEVLQALGPRAAPTVVFISAYPDHALRAFDAYALDFLLKPFEAARFATALGRAAERVHARDAEPDVRLAALLEFLQRPPRPPERPDRIAIRVGTQYQLVPVADIEYVEADDNYARIHLPGGERLVSQTLTQLEQSVLGPPDFVRIHRSTIVNVSRIASLVPLFHGELSVVLIDGRRLVCSRRQRRKLQELIFFAG